MFFAVTLDGVAYRCVMSNDVRPIKIELDASERKQIADAIRLAIASCNRLAARVGQVSAVAAEYRAEASRLGVVLRKVEVLS